MLACDGVSGIDGAREALLRVSGGADLGLELYAMFSYRDLHSISGTER